MSDASPSGRSPGRRGRLGAAVGVVVVVAAAVAWAVDDGGDDAAVTVVAAPASEDATSSTTSTTGSSTSTATSAATSSPTTATTAASVVPTTTTVATTTTTTTAPRRHQIASDERGRWSIHLDEGSDCIELETAGHTFGELLCGAAPAGQLIGRSRGVDTPSGRLLVSVVDPTVTHYSVDAATGHAYYDPAVGEDPTTPGRSFAVGEAGPGPLQVIVGSGEHTIGRVFVPDGAREFGEDELLHDTDPPYGRWPAYRHAANFGLFLGGRQEVGFYDGDGARCALFRRFGGEHEGVLADLCARPAGQLEDAGPSFPDQFVLSAVGDAGADGVHIELPDGSVVPTDAEPHPDPAGSGATALTEFASFVEIPPRFDHVTFVLRRGGEEMDRVEVPVPGR